MRAMRALRADLSGPVLAILVTVAIIAAGIGVLAYFWWMAPHASKAATIEIIGAPAYDAASGTAYITIKNVGNEVVKVKALTINGQPLRPIEEVEIGPGEKADVIFTGGPTVSEPTVEAILVTDGGTVPITLYVVSSASNSVPLHAD